LIGWAVGAVLLGLIVGTLATATVAAALKDANIQKVLQSLAPGRTIDQAGLLISTIMVFVGMLAAVAGLQIVLRLRSEETDGRAELVRATPISRGRWLLDAVIGGGAAVLIVVVPAGLAALISFASVGDAAHGWRALDQAVAELPAALSVVGGAAVLVAFLPRIAVALSWILFSLAVVIGLFGELLDLPTALRDASPFSSVPAVPIDDWGPTVVLLGADLVLVALAALLVRRRELTA
jgi:ABC-2 type transport system permease protein